MRQFIQQWLQRSSVELRHSLQFLNPSSGACPFCGKGFKLMAMNASSTNPHAEGKKAYLSYLPTGFNKMVCSSCQAIIPWLAAIRCRVCGRGITCPDCIRRTEAHFIANRSAVQYSAEMREWLAQYKYRGNEKLEPLLAQMMFPALAAITREAVAQTAATRSGSIQSQLGLVSPASVWDAITFVPVSSERAEERGFNQAERFAAILSRHHHIPLFELLVRERHTEKQSFKSRLERMKDTRRLFRAKPETMTSMQKAVFSTQESGKAAPQPSRPIRILLIDDIYTTGSTIEACAAALHRQTDVPLEIYALTWARS